MKSRKVKKLNLGFEKVIISKLEQATVYGGDNNEKTDGAVRPTQAGESCVCTWNEVFGG